MSFAQPLSKLGSSGIGVAQAPTGGMGLALNDKGQVPAGALTEPNHIVGNSGEISFAANYGHYASATDRPVRFWKDALGMVHLAGWIARAGGTPGLAETMFTLPEGYRPDFQSSYNAAAGEAGAAGVNDSNGARVDVNTNGTVTHVRSLKAYVENDFVALDGMTFRAA